MGDVLKQLTVGVGGSDRSFQALRYAMWLGRSGQSRVSVVIVNELMPALSSCWSHGDLLHRVTREAEIMAHEHDVEVRRKVEGMARRMNATVEIECIHGRVVDSLAAVEAQTSLFVVGKRGHGERRGGLLGSNAEMLVRRTHRPVLLTPKEFSTPRRIIVGFAGKSTTSLAVSTAAELSRELALPLTVVVVHRDGPERERIVALGKRVLESHGANGDIESTAGSPTERLCAASARDALLVLGATERSRVYRLVLGDVTEEVMRSAKGPILIAAKTEIPVASATNAT